MTSGGKQYLTLLYHVVVPLMTRSQIVDRNDYIHEGFEIKKRNRQISWQFPGVRPKKSELSHQITVHCLTLL